MYTRTHARTRTHTHTHTQTLLIYNICGLRYNITENSSSGILILFVNSYMNYSYIMMLVNLQVMLESTKKDVRVKDVVGYQLK